MKEKDVVIGNYYRFYCTDVEHRKFMINTIVKVIGKQPGRINKNSYNNNNGPTKGPTRFKLENGHKCNAGNLKEIENNE